MEALDDYILDPLEQGFDKLGAMQGELAPLKRAAIGAAVGYAFVEIVKPSVAYDDNGKELPFTATADKTEPKTTYFPWWMFVAIPAFVSGVLI